MTSLSFILGVTPLAVATGAGAEMRQLLGTAVLFGVSMSTEPGPQICTEQGPLMETLWGSARRGEAGPGCAAGASAGQ
jgi:hypothetical protein